MHKGDLVLYKGKAYEVFSHVHESDTDERNCIWMEDTVVLLDRANCDRITVEWRTNDSNPFSCMSDLCTQSGDIDTKISKLNKEIQKLQKKKADLQYDMEKIFKLDKK